MRKYISFFTAVCTLLCISGCKINITESATAREPDDLRAAVVVLTEDTQSDVYSEMYNSLVANMSVEKITCQSDYSDYDLIYLDKSLLKGSFNTDSIKSYVSNGGSLFLENSFIDSFDLDFIGAKSKEHIEGCPVDMTYPEGIGYNRIQGLLYDFTKLYKSYKNFDTLSGLDYGFGIIPSTAVSIASYNDITLYSMNKYGIGNVFFTNALLPNDFSVQTLRPGSSGEYLSATGVGANILIRSYFAEFVSMQKYGYSIERSFGSFATRQAAWQLHYEDIEGIKNKSAVTFTKLAKKYGQFPSYSLVRCPYVWFTRSETVTYALQGEYGLEQDSYESIYSSGDHLVSMGKWLSLDKYDDTDSYFIDSTEYVKRAYPSPCDINNDGNMDIICGSADGYIYAYYGSGLKTNYELGVSTYITDPDGNPINVGSYSSPSTLDFDGDGTTDIICGSEGGTLYFLHNEGGLVYSLAGSMETGLLDSMVDCGDLNGDGNLDLAVGSRTGQLYIYYGTGGFMNFSEPIAVETGAPWIAPCITDFDNDGVAEIYYGTYEGYIAKLENSPQGFKNDGYIQSNSMNMNGNFNIKFGQNCVPRFYDMNKDGKLDIISGMLEYGNAVPIDSEYFPCREELQDQVDYFKKNYIYLGIHSYTSEYSTFEQESAELEMHKKAFNQYNIPWEGSGANQHTWHTSKVGYNYDFKDAEAYNGTYMSQYKSGLLWNSGSQTPASEAVPQVSAENSLALPFYLFGSEADMLMLQPSNIPYGDYSFAYIGAKYDVPMLFYNHCDHIFRDESEQEELIKIVDDFVSEADYSFVSENQLAKAAAAAYNTEVIAYSENGRITLKAKTRSDNIPLYDSDYQACVGVRVIFPNDSTYTTDASVWRQSDNSVYVALDREVHISPSEEVKSSICAVNIPAKITLSQSSAKVAFKDNGIMEVKVNGRAEAVSDGWDMSFEDGITTFRKYGKADTLIFK
ncbi:MAG: VCBS repeat-containing protein [Clostridiales bacterium]|nr:VCBS repeat-containing protein [Clostridiales bacterium]